MTLNALLKPVIPSIPTITADREIETLRMLPPETLFLALKEADSESALWVMENATALQVQGCIDLDCWQGDQFIAERFFRYFEFMTYVTPEKLLEYMNDLDPEVIVLALMDCIDVVDFDPQEPPEVDESKMILSPDNKYALLIKTEDPNLRERLFQWMNKLSHMNIDLMRRHLESLKWEQRGDLEEFGYQIKKGRIEELGFVEREEALKFFSAIRAPDLKQHLLAHPLLKNIKEETPLIEILGSEDFLPQPIAKAVKDEGFFKSALELIEEFQLKDVLRLEVVRTINGVFSAEDELSKELEVLRESAARTRAYLDLGLLYLSGGTLNAAADLLVTQPVFEVARLGWTLVQDLVRAANDLTGRFLIGIFEPVDRELLTALKGRHPNVRSPDVQRDLGLTEAAFLNLESIHKVATQLGALSVAAHFLNETLAASLHFADDPLESTESAWTRLATGVFRQSCGREFSVRPVNQAEWNEIIPSYNPETFKKLSGLIADKVPSIGRALFEKRLNDRRVEIEGLLERKSQPDSRFFHALRWE